MYKQWKEALIAALLAVVLPSVVFLCIPSGVTTIPLTPEQHTGEQTESTDAKFMIPVLMNDGSVHNMDMNEYLIGVVLCEMPATFETEALKAQSVVARTYALKRYTVGEKHDFAAICTDPTCCQGYVSPSEYVENGGTQGDIDKIVQAVIDTTDEVLMYNGSLIEATYFSCSGGKTEDAQAVWGSEIPYLQAVNSPGEEKAAHYTDTVTFTAEEFQSMLGVQFSGAAGTWIKAVTYTPGGGVDTMQICDKLYSGVTLRQKLGLRSTAFVMTAVGSTITVTTKGFGHRVGMSQYGSDAMAISGSNYIQILAHYYQGAELAQFTP